MDDELKEHILTNFQKEEANNTFSVIETQLSCYSNCTLSRPYSL